MKILQWNVWYNEDISNVLTLLKEVDADVVCLQELTVGHPHHNHEVDDTVEYIAKGLGFNHYYIPATETVVDGVDMNFGNAIFSRYPLRDTTTALIQERDPEKPDHFDNESRRYVEAVVEGPAGPVTIGTVHMSYTDRFAETDAKTKETNARINILKTKSGYYVFTGDLNAVPGSYTIEEVGKVLTHAGPDMAEPTWTTKPFSYNGFEATELQWRLDYCFVTPETNVTSAEIVQTDFSDHLPVLVEIA